MKRPRWLVIGLAVIICAIILTAGCLDGTASSLTDFPDEATLAGWVESHAQPFEPGSGAGAWYQAALAVQREAASDGYLVSAVIAGSADSPDEYMVWCTALAGGDLYWWHPEETEPSLMFTGEELELEAE